MERGDAVVKQLLRPSLALGERAPRPFNVRAGTRMIAIEEERARPDVDSLIVLPREIVIQTGEEELLDFGVAISFRCGAGITARVNIAALILGQNTQSILDYGSHRMHPERQ